MWKKFSFICVNCTHTCSKGFFVHVIRGTVCVEIYGLCGTHNKGDSVCGNLWFVWYT